MMSFSFSNVIFSPFTLFTLVFVAIMLFTAAASGVCLLAGDAHGLRRDRLPRADPQAGFSTG